MRTVRVVNRDNGHLVAGAVGLADGWWTRFRGLMGRPEPGPDGGLLLRPCRSIHMLGMRYPIDVAFLDADHRVVGMHIRCLPGLRVWGHPRALAALELRAGRLAETHTGVGDHLEVLPVTGAGSARKESI